MDARMDVLTINPLGMNEVFIGKPLKPSVSLGFILVALARFHHPHLWGTAQSCLLMVGVIVLDQ